MECFGTCLINHCSEYVFVFIGHEAMDFSPWETEKMCGWQSLQASALAHTHKMHFIMALPQTTSHLARQNSSL